MNILIFNCGSSSQSFKLYRVDSTAAPVVLASGKAKNVATQTQSASRLIYSIHGQERTVNLELPSHQAAANAILDTLEKETATEEKIDRIGHRFVHGGSYFDHSVEINAATYAKLKDCLHLAPIHNPNSFSVIEVCRDRYPDVPQYAVFDTAFHAGMPAESKVYAIPKTIAEQFGFHKYGFHGLSYQYVSQKCSEILGKPLAKLKLVICHLGTGGSSVVAIQNGIAIDNSMGYSPLAGLIMSTRSGDVDPEIVLELVRQGRSADEVDHLLNYESGLLGISGYSSNLNEIIAAAENGNPDCQLAFDAYCHRLKSTIGAFIWQLNGADALVFTDDLGVENWKMRQKVCSNEENLGLMLDFEKNRSAPGDRPACLSQTASKIQIWSIPNDEESVIVDEILKLTHSLDESAERIP